MVTQVCAYKDAREQAKTYLSHFSCPRGPEIHLLFALAHVAHALGPLLMPPDLVPNGGEVRLESISPPVVKFVHASGSIGDGCATTGCLQALPVASGDFDGSGRSGKDGTGAGLVSRQKERREVRTAYGMI